MTAGNALATIAETQIGTRSDLVSGKAAVYGYLLATDAKLGAYQQSGHTGASEPLFAIGYSTRDRTTHSTLRVFDCATPNPVPRSSFYASIAGVRHSSIGVYCSSF